MWGGEEFSRTAAMRGCPGFAWGRVHFLSSSCHGAVFWVQYEENADNTLMFSVVAQ